MVTFVHPRCHWSFLPPSPISFFLWLFRTPCVQASHGCLVIYGAWTSPRDHPLFLPLCYEHSPGITPHPTPCTPQKHQLSIAAQLRVGHWRPSPIQWNVDDLIYSDKRGCWELMHTVPISHRSDALLYCLHCISVIHKTNFTKSIIRKRNKELILST